MEEMVFHSHVCSVLAQTPVQRVNKYKDLRDALMRRIVLSTLQFRINSRYKVQSLLDIEYQRSYLSEWSHACAILVNPAEQSSFLCCQNVSPTYGVGHRVQILHSTV